jgi:O-antigen ligase
MFAFLSILLLYAIFLFGAVRPFDLLLIGTAAVVGFAWFAMSDVIRGRPLNYGFLLFAVLCFSTMAFAGVRAALGLFAAGWAWEASRRSERSQLKFLWFLFAVGWAEAQLGLHQRFVDPGWMFGYRNPFTVSSGTLINRNHFAGLLEMLVPVAFGLAFAAVRRERGRGPCYVFLLGGALMGLGIVFSLSRAGIFCLLVTLLFLAILWRAHASGGLRLSRIAMTLPLLLVGGALWVALDTVSTRYGELFAQENSKSEERMVLFRDTLNMIRANPAGVGSGKYEDVFRRYQTSHHDVSFSHAHNDYLETLAEWGVIAGALYWLLVFFIFLQTIRVFLGNHSPERGGVMLACLGAMFTMLLHSLVDFNLQIPSNAMLFYSFAGMALYFVTVENAPNRHPGYFTPPALRRHGADYFHF